MKSFILSPSKLPATCFILLFTASAFIHAAVAPAISILAPKNQSARKVYGNPNERGDNDFSKKNAGETEVG